MGRWLVVTTSCMLVAGSVALAPSARAADPDAAVGIWIQRTHPADDLPGAKVIVTASRARPARQMLVTEGEGMVFADLVLRKGATSTQVTVTPLPPDGMRLVSGGCDRVPYDEAASGIAPFDYVIRDGHVIVTLPRGMAASCVFWMAPTGLPGTDTLPATGPRPTRTEPGGLLAFAGLLGLLAGLRRFRPQRRSDGPRA